MLIIVVLLVAMLITLWFQGQKNSSCVGGLDDRLVQINEKLNDISIDLSRLREYLDEDIDSEHPAFQLKHKIY